MEKKALFHFSIFTLFGFSTIGYIILFFHKELLFWDLFKVENPISTSVYGLGLGVVVALLGLMLLKLNIFNKVNDVFSKMIKDLNLQWYHILFYSFCAGVGEEILFRGAIQAYIHIWPTAIIFVLLHGYVNPKDLKTSIYGVFLILVSAGFGYMMKYWGIYAAMSAHFIYDVIMFSYLKYYNNK